MAREVYEQILKTGRVETSGWLGAALEPVTEKLAEQLDLKTLRGVVVSRVYNDSPAEKAGVKPGDVIVGWGDKEIGEFRDLSFLVARTKPGTKVQVHLIRGHEKLDVTVTVGTQPIGFQR